jgi:hypothetical protein
MKDRHEETALLAEEEVEGRKGREDQINEKRPTDSKEEEN